MSRGGDKGWHVFYHFVGAVPGSTELEQMLRRLLKEIGVISVRNIIITVLLLLYVTLIFDIVIPVKIS